MTITTGICQVPEGPQTRLGFSPAVGSISSGSVPPHNFSVSKEYRDAEILEDKKEAPGEGLLVSLSMVYLRLSLIH